MPELTYRDAVARGIAQEMAREMVSPMQQQMQAFIVKLSPSIFTGRRRQRTIDDDERVIKSVPERSQPG